MNPTFEPYGGYALTNLHQAGGEETLRFEAFVTLHGRKVLHVSNGGVGGSHRYQPVTYDWAGFRATLATFEGYAVGWNAGSEFAGYEDADQLVNRLIDVAALNRMRVVPFVLDGGDYWQTGECHRFTRSATREQVIAALTGPEYAHRTPRVWEKAVGDFVLVGDVVGEPVDGECP